MWGSGNVPGTCKRAVCNLVPPLLPPSLSPEEVRWTQTQWSRGHAFTLGLLGKNLPGHPAKGCHFWDKYDFLSGQFYEGHSKRFIYSGNSLADWAVQQLLPLHCKQELALKFSEEVYKGTVYLSDVCFSAGHTHRWPLTLTFCITPSQGPGFKSACSVPDGTACLRVLTIRASSLSLGGSDWQMNCTEERKHANYENILLGSHRKRM